MSERRSPASGGESEDSVRARWESAQAALRERWDEPIERATELTRKTLAWFPIRVWRHFLQHNGFLLAAGVSYQALFAIFASIYVAFAIAGLWVGNSQNAINWLIETINSYIPGLISENGLVHPEDVVAVAGGTTSVLWITGVIAFGVAVWTSIGFVTFARRAVRDTFGLTFDRRNYVVLKSRDLLAALVFGVALLLGSVLTNVATWALELVVSMLGGDTKSLGVQILLRIQSMSVGFAINTCALAGLFRFLTGTSLRWRTIWPGAMLGGAAMTVLQIGAGLLVSYSPSNPLLATFTVFIGFLLWFRLNGIVILVAAAWIAVAARDRDLPLQLQSEQERLIAEHSALVTAARVRVREAKRERDDAPWWQVWRAEREVRAAQQQLDRVLENAPDPVRPSLNLLE